MLHIGAIAIFARLCKFISGCRGKNKYREVGIAEVIGGSALELPSSSRITGYTEVTPVQGITSG
jgi:hypothetical protein